MHLNDGRARQVGRGDNRPLGFYGVGATSDVVIPACDPTNDPTCLQTLTWASTGTPIDSSQVSVTTSDPSSWFNFMSGAVAPINKATPAKAASSGSSSSGTTYLLIAVGVVGLLVMMKR